MNNEVFVCRDIYGYTICDNEMSYEKESGESMLPDEPSNYWFLSEEEWCKMGHKPMLTGSQKKFFLMFHMIPKRRYGGLNKIQLKNASII